MLLTLTALVLSLQNIAVCAGVLCFHAHTSVCDVLLYHISQSPHHHFRLAADILKGITRKITGTFLFLETGFFFPSFFVRCHGFLRRSQCLPFISLLQMFIAVLCLFGEREFRLKRRLFSVVPWHDGML